MTALKTYIFRGIVILMIIIDDVVATTVGYSRCGRGIGVITTATIAIGFPFLFG